MGKTKLEHERQLQKEIDAMKSFKQSEFQPCLLCGKGMGHNQDLDFYRVHLERFFIDYSKVQQQHGLEMSMGGAAALAQIMGPDHDLAKEVSPHPTFLVCSECAMDKGKPLALLSEYALNREDG